MNEEELIEILKKYINEHNLLDLSVDITPNEMRVIHGRYILSYDIRISRRMRQET